MTFHETFELFLTFLSSKVYFVSKGTSHKLIIDFKTKEGTNMYIKFD